jgi:hypothetical protein
MRRLLFPVALAVTLITGAAGAAHAQSSVATQPSVPAASETDNPDVVASKLFFAPTGRSLKQGEAYFALDALAIAVLRVGVTDRFSIGVGRPLFANVTWVTPKFQVYDGPRTSVATGVLQLFAPGFGYGGVAYGVTTVGSRDDGLTAGMGWFYGKDDDGQDKTSAVLIVGGDRRMGRRSKLVTENYIFKGGAVLSAGSRIIGRHRSVEFGGMLVVAGNTMMPGAVVNLVFHTSRAR